MKNIFQSIKQRFSQPFRGALPPSEAPRQQLWLWSLSLGRHVSLTLLLPPTSKTQQKYGILIFNDGQDFDRLSLPQTLTALYEKNKFSQPFVTVGIHADGNRMSEYGTASQADYAGRGDKAKNHTQFIVRELLPFLRQQYPCETDPRKVVIAGFSLGGLSAFDVAWANAETFGKVGVFSGSLWWRSRAFTAAAPDADRIMHQIVSQSAKQVGLEFWFEAGTNDEKDDRNDNGIIDAIDDTLDLIKILHQKGYSESDVRYVEVKDGEHNPDTWGKIMPDFLQWAFGKH